MQFYIHSDDKPHGPFDLIGMIRRIRSGSLNAADIVSSDDGEKLQAQNHPKLVEFFAEDSELLSNLSASDTPEKLSLGALASSSLTILMRQRALLIFSTVMLIILLGCVYGLQIILPLWIVLIIAFFIAQQMFNILCYMSLRALRGHPINLGTIGEIIGKHFVSFLLVGIITGVSTVLLLPLVAIPGLLVNAVFSLAIFVALDKNAPIIAALKESSRLITKTHLTGALPVAFSCTVLLFVSAVFLVVPLILTLPLSALILAQLYERLSTVTDRQ